MPGDPHTPASRRDTQDHPPALQQGAAPAQAPRLVWMDTQEHVSSEEEAATCAHSHAMAGSWAVSIYDLGEIDIQVTWHKVLTTPGATIEHGKRIAEAVLQAQRTAAPTSEYVSGWLAAADALDAEQRPFYAHWLRALAPPYAPPVQQIEDRMLLLKALLGADAQRTGPDELIIYTGERSPPPRFTLTLDAEGFPILTPELRAALIKATEAANG